jgi:hypothetical protein
MGCTQSNIVEPAVRTPELITPVQQLQKLPQEENTVGAVVINSSYDEKRPTSRPSSVVLVKEKDGESLKKENSRAEKNPEQVKSEETSIDKIENYNTSQASLKTFTLQDSFENENSGSNRKGVDCEKPSLDAISIKNDQDQVKDVVGDDEVNVSRIVSDKKENFGSVGLNDENAFSSSTVKMEIKDTPAGVNLVEEVDLAENETANRDKEEVNDNDKENKSDIITAKNETNEDSKVKNEK